METFKDAVEVVRKGIENDPQLYYVYQANIAVAFQDEFSRCDKQYKNRTDIHEISNNAAKNFLNLWIQQ